MVAQQADSSLVHFLDNISYRPRVGPSPSPVLKNYVSNLEMDLDWPVIPIHLGIWNPFNCPLILTWKGKYILYCWLYGAHDYGLYVEGPWP